MTNSSFANLSLYFIEIEWVLTWFPIRDQAVIDRPSMRTGIVKQRSDDSALGMGGGSSQVHWLGEPEGLPPTRSAVAFAQIFSNLDHQLSVLLEINLSNVSSRRLFAAPPRQRLPFTLNSGHDANGTALTLCGTIITSAQLGLRLLAADR